MSTDTQETKEPRNDSTRNAVHAGSWYSKSRLELEQQLDEWLSSAKMTHGPARAIIAPHAGYQYSGACSAFAYRQIDPSVVRRIFILGPAHNFRMSDCGLSSARIFKTPLYDLRVDRRVYKELEKTGLFRILDMNVDEQEHSIELNLPYIAKTMEEYKDKFSIIPIVVGSLNKSKEEVYGKLFAKYLGDKQNLFVISTDFCHWGSRFRYTYHNLRWGKIYESIRVLDKSAMDTIESLNPSAFAGNLRKYSNTICGRHPISILLYSAQHLENNSSVEIKMKLKFIKYEQSGKCKSQDDSSVSYASASLVIE